ncbi:hypothetical protein IJ750_03710 [bacterium]|nr:hypothetical protein [bacterium]
MSIFANKISAASKTYQPSVQIGTDKGKLSEKPVTVFPLKAHDFQEQNTKCWSEGLDRNIDYIILSNHSGIDNRLDRITEKLEAIGKEVGFEVKRVDSEIWLEDYSIRRADGKIYVPVYNKNEEWVNEHINALKIILNRFDISLAGQGNAMDNKSKEYAQNIRESNKYVGFSYLEGGNVLNTKLPDGTPAAIIGEESIGYTLALLGLDDTEENIQFAKKHIAHDLGLEEKNITYIPQADFHIDMYYRPLQNGVIAIPDYEAGVKILQNIELDGLSDKERRCLILDLQIMDMKSMIIMEDAEEALKKAGYNLVKIPCFWPANTEIVTDEDAERDDKPRINYMNGICGTSKDGQTYYITNESNYPELNEIIEKHFEEAGIDKVFFVPTANYLSRNGGIDCLTQECGRDIKH